MTKQAAYDLLLKVSQDTATRKKFLSDPVSVLGSTGLALSEPEVNEARDIVAGLSSSDEFSKLYEKLQTNFAEMAIAFRASVLRVIGQIEEGYKDVMQMYVVAFYVGIGLFILAGISGLWLHEDVLTFVFGGLGTADILAYFIKGPPERLQVSRGNLAQLEMAFVNWIGDMHNWNEIFTQVLAESKSHVELISNASKISASMLSNVKDTMNAIDQYCEPKEG